MHRRGFLHTLTAALPAKSFAQAEQLPPIRALTRDPGFHWFGY
jgi:hypothetical protein